MLLGAHKSAAGGYENAVKAVAEIGGNCLQIFSVSPRRWQFADPSDEDIEKFQQALDNYNIGPVYFHASYLINLADTGRVGHLSKKSLKAELKTASKLGVEGSIVHLGSFKSDKDKLAFEEDNYEDFLDNIKEVLDETPDDTVFIAENSGNNKVGKTIEELGRVVKDIDSDRLKICLDTCHLHATGYDVSSKEKLDDFLAHFDDLVGIDRLELIHLNDSRDELGSFRDRHANIGGGEIGKKVFELVLNHSQLKELPFIIEVPGFDEKGPDKKNLDILKSLI